MNPLPAGLRVGRRVDPVTGHGFVTLAWGNRAAQLTPGEARIHAMLVLASAEAAESGADLFAELAEDMGIRPSVALKIVSNLWERQRRRQG